MSSSSKTMYAAYDLCLTHARLKQAAAQHDASLLSWSAVEHWMAPFWSQAYVLFRRLLGLPAVYLSQYNQQQRKRSSGGEDSAPTAVEEASLMLPVAIPLLYGLSPHLSERPSYWPASIDAVGFWSHSTPSHFTPPRTLVDFLTRTRKDAKEAEAGSDGFVYVGFGTMAQLALSADERSRLLRCVIDALTAIGKRAVVQGLTTAAEGCGAIADSDKASARLPLHAVDSDAKAEAGEPAAKRQRTAEADCGSDAASGTQAHPTIDTQRFCLLSADEYVPHEWLFARQGSAVSNGQSADAASACSSDKRKPRILDSDSKEHTTDRMAECELVVHHGGAGTTQTALRFHSFLKCFACWLTTVCRHGLPQVICPFAFDQRHWAERLHWLGVAEVVELDSLLGKEQDKPPAAAASEQTAINRVSLALGAAMKKALSSQHRSSADTLAKLMRADEGTVRAVKVVVETLAR